MKKNLVLINIICGILSACGSVSKDPISLSSRMSRSVPITTLQAAEIDARMESGAVSFKDEAVTFNSTMADQFNAKPELKEISYINTMQGTRNKLILDSGVFHQNFLIQDGVCDLKNATIKGDFMSHGGAVRIDTDYDTTIEGKFESTGNASLTPHRHPTNGIRIVNIGSKSFEVGRALFDGSDIKSDGSFMVGGSEFNIVLTDNVSGDYKTKPSVIKASKDVTFSTDKTTIINFEKLNKSIIKAGSTHALVKAEIIDVDISKFRLDYRYSSTSLPGVQPAEDKSIEFSKEIDGANQYLIMKVLKDIAAVASPYLERCHKHHAYNLASHGVKKHHFGKHAFNPNIHTVALSDEFEVNLQDSGNGFGFSKGKNSSLLQGYANFDESSKNAHVYKSFSLGSVLISGQAGFYLENSAKANTGSSYTGMTLSKLFSADSVTFLPKLSFDYMHDLNSLYGLNDQDGFFVASFETPNTWIFSPGVEASSTFNIKGMRIETSVNFEHMQDLGSRKIMIDGQSYDASWCKTSLDFGVKAVVDSYTNLRGTCGVSSDRQGVSGNLSLGIGMKI